MLSGLADRIETILRQTVEKAGQKLPMSGKEVQEKDGMVSKRMRMGKFSPLSESMLGLGVKEISLKIRTNQRCGIGVAA